MVPLAMTLWAGQLLTHTIFGLWMPDGRRDGYADNSIARHGFDGQGVSGSVSAFSGKDMFKAIQPTLSITLPALALLATFAWHLYTHMQHGRAHQARGGTAVSKGVSFNGPSTPVHALDVWRHSSHVLLLIGVLAAAVVSSLTGDLYAWSDPAMRQTLHSGQPVQVQLRVRGPASTSPVRQASCQADASLESLFDGKSLYSSKAPIQLLLAERSTCPLLVTGASLRATGTLSRSEFSRRPLSLLVMQGQKVEETSQASWTNRAVHDIWKSFFRVTDRLSDQGRVLVPGLTIGLLGQDYPLGGYDLDGQTGPRGGEHPEEPPAINSTYATLLELYFRLSGIIHLMAVSGGHFVIIARWSEGWVPCCSCLGNWWLCLSSCPISFSLEWSTHRIQCSEPC